MGGLGLGESLPAILGDEVGLRQRPDPGGGLEFTGADQPTDSLHEDLALFAPDVKVAASFAWERWRRRCRGGIQIPTRPPNLILGRATRVCHHLLCILDQTPGAAEHLIPGRFAARMPE